MSLNKSLKIKRLENSKKYSKKNKKTFNYITSKGKL